GQPEIGLKASLSPSIRIKNAAIIHDTLFITIDKNVNMKDNPNMIYSIEALLLTAKEFGVNMVKVENSPINQVGRFDLTKKIKVPVAPNLRNIQ
ncbi:MAG: negative regulator of sigma-X activity, partial [Neobacillus sp.]